jgi:hypothetical protein
MIFFGHTLNSRLQCLLCRCSTTWATPPALVCVWYFLDRVSKTICSGWLWTAVLLISASWVVRTTGVSHWHSADSFIKKGFCYVAGCPWTQDLPALASRMLGLQTGSNIPSWEARIFLWPNTKSDDSITSVVFYLETINAVHTRGERMIQMTITRVISEAAYNSDEAMLMWHSSVTQITY